MIACSTGSAIGKTSAYELKTQLINDLQINNAKGTVMDWFYVDAGKQTGPVSEAEFDQLAQSGRIQAATLVWREGMADWTPLSGITELMPPRQTLVPPPPASYAASTTSWIVPPQREEFLQR